MRFKAEVASLLESAVLVWSACLFLGCIFAALLAPIMLVAKFIFQ